MVGDNGLEAQHEWGPEVVVGLVDAQNRGEHGERDEEQLEEDDAGTTASDHT